MNISDHKHSGAEVIQYGAYGCAICLAKELAEVQQTESNDQMRELPSGCTSTMGLPAVIVAAIHQRSPQCICPACGKRWRECGCEMTPRLRQMIGDPPHQSRPWGFKGAMKLPDDHPDNPNRK